MRRFLIVLCLAACARAAADEKTNALAEFSGALERLAATVAPAVVQVQVSAWCASASANREDAASLNSCRVVGSGVIVDPSGYIITNEHVVRNARRIRVMLTPKSDHSEDGLALPRKTAGAGCRDCGRKSRTRWKTAGAGCRGCGRESRNRYCAPEDRGLRPADHPAPTDREGPPPGTGCARCRQPRRSRQYDDDWNRQRRRPPAASRIFQCSISRPTPPSIPETVAVHCWTLKVN